MHTFTLVVISILAVVELFLLIQLGRSKWGRLFLNLQQEEDMQVFAWVVPIVGLFLIVAEHYR